VIKVVIKTGLEQTQLFQCDRSHCADFCNWNCDWFFRTSAAHSEKFRLKSTKINQRMHTAISLYITGSR